MSSMSYWIEYMLSLPGSEDSVDPGKLVYQVGVDYVFPVVPPNTAASLVTAPPGTPPGASSRGTTSFTGYYPAEALIFYRMKFGYVDPGAFKLTIIGGGTTAFDGTLTGSFLEEGIDYLYFLTKVDSAKAYFTNLTNVNQYLQLNSQYLVVPSSQNWELLKKYLRQAHFPIPIPTVGA
ncbi:MAG: hypothetical protein ACYDHZ_00710 [Dehalococcoidia bacterium]